ETVERVMRAHHKNGAAGASWVASPTLDVILKADLWARKEAENTVGFGDITAKSDGARLLVTGQMMLDLVVLGVVVKLILNAIKLSQQAHSD
ncbi:MAG: ion channel, partial [Acidimicrobiales bacterium]